MIDASDPGREASPTEATWFFILQEHQAGTNGITSQRFLLGVLFHADMTLRHAAATATQTPKESVPSLDSGNKH